MIHERKQCENLFSASQIETFAQQQPALETNLKYLCQGLTKYLERQTEVYERDILKLSDFFSKVHGAFQVDNTTTGKFLMIIVYMETFSFAFFQVTETFQIQYKRLVLHIPKWLNYIKTMYDSNISFLY